MHSGRLSSKGMNSADPLTWPGVKGLMSHHCSAGCKLIRQMIIIEQDQEVVHLICPKCHNEYITEVMR